MSTENIEQEEPQAENENVQRAVPVTPFYSYIFIAFLVAVSAVQIATNLEMSVVLAGFVKPLFMDGQYWRILTGSTLHGGLAHLAMNCYAFYILGKLIETLSNRAHLAVVFVLAAIGGGILSLFFYPEGISVGASGGIVGFLGYLTVYGYKRRKLLTDAFLKNMLFNVGLMAFIGFVIPNVDNFGHLGGLIVGAVYGFLQIPGDLYKDPRQASRTTKILGYAALGIFILTSLFSVLILTGIVKVEIPTIQIISQMHRVYPFQLSVVN